MSLRTGAHLMPRIQLSRAAVLVCDVQEKFRPVMWSYPALINTAVKTLEAAKILEIPVLVTEQYPQGLGKTVSQIQNVLDQFPPGQTITLPKTKFSMVFPSSSQFLSNVRPGGVKDVIIFGIESHVCVLQSVLDLRQEGYNVFVLADGISSTNAGEIGIAIKMMKSAGAVISTSESILFQLMGDAKHPAFKQISSLIKRELPNTAASVSTFLGTGGRL